MIDRIYAQYRDKPKAVAWYSIIPTLAAEIKTAYDGVRFSYDIDSNSGEQLNVIGRIVNVSRGYESLISFDTISYFGANNFESQFGGSDAQFNSTGAILTKEISDAIYRLLLKAKISKNNNESTLDGIASALYFITESSPITVVDNEDMTFSISFGSELNDIERFVLNTFDIIPRPQGVRFVGYVEETAITQFGGSFRWGDSRATFGQFFGV